MLSEYISKALSLAHYEIIDDDEPFYAEIKGIEGVWATGLTLETCRERLIEVLEGWILVRVRKGFSVPTLDNISLPVPREIEISE